MVTTVACNHRNTKYSPNVYLTKIFPPNVYLTKIFPPNFYLTKIFKTFSLTPTQPEIVVNKM